MSTYVVTGGARGLGFEIAKNLSSHAGSKLILAVRDIKQGHAAAEKIGKNVEVSQLDMSNSNSVTDFVASINDPISGLVNNAGVQLVDNTYNTVEGYEQTFAVNHLFALKLTMGLLPKMQNGRVLFIGSGTHNPNNRTATIFGFRGAQFKSIENCAEGINTSSNNQQLGMDRYATSKFLNMVTTVELSRRIDAEKASFYCLDPGLMAGTGLARSAPNYMQFAWNYILPVAAKLMPDTSTPIKSGGVGAWLMTADKCELENGAIYDYERKLSTRVWDRVKNPDIGKQIVDESMRLLERF